MLTRANLLAALTKWIALGRPSRFTAKNFQRRQRKFAADYEKVAAAILAHVEFRTMFDVGCANGFLLAAFRDAGKEVRGIELSPEIHSIVGRELVPLIAIGDFAQASGTYDLVCCIEVAEHIEAQRSEELVEKLTSLATQTIFFTAAPPGQFGHGHINCRPHVEWVEWFRARGWVVDRERTDQIKAKLKSLEKAHWLETNCFLLQRTPAT